LFSAQQPVLFSPKFCWLIRLNCALFCDSSRLIMSAKYQQSEAFSYFKKVKCGFLARSHTISLNKGLLNTSSHLCSCKCVLVGKNTWLCVLRSLYDLPGQRCSLESPRLQQAKHATSAKHLVNWDWTVSKCSDTNTVFQTTVFLIPVVRNNRRSSGIDGKTSDCLSRNSLYYRYYVFASNCSLSRLNLRLLFFRWFSRGKSIDIKMPD